MPLKRGNATITIVTARLGREAHIVLVAAATFALLAYLQRLDDASAKFAGALVFGTLAGIVAALLQRGHARFREMELCELTAPLFGRELARATAAVPCLILTAALLAYWLTAFAYSHTQTPPDWIAVTACASYAAALVAMCATVRRGFARMLYVVLACAVSGGAFILAGRSTAGTLVFCGLCGFTALRQYGEALARYDPV